MVLGHVQVGEEAVDFGVADVGAVEEGDEVEEGEPGDEVEVEFTEEFFVNCCSFLIAFACIRVCNIWQMASGVDVLLFMNRRAVALAMVARSEVGLFHYEGLVEHMNNKV